MLTELRIECTGAGSITATLHRRKGESQFLELYRGNTQDDKLRTFSKQIKSADSFNAITLSIKTGC